MPISPLVHRLISMGPPDPGYHLERSLSRTVEETTAWMGFWHGENGACIWLSVAPDRRDETAKHWLFLRHVHATDWRQRGGLDELG